MDRQEKIKKLAEWYGISTNDWNTISLNWDPYENISDALMLLDKLNLERWNITYDIDDEFLDVKKNYEFSAYKEDGEFPDIVNYGSSIQEAICEAVLEYINEKI